MERCICMSVNELKRLEIVIKVIEKRLRQSETADILNVSVRQMKRLIKQFRIHCRRFFFNKIQFYVIIRV